MIVYAEEALDDLERIFEFNVEREPAGALRHVEVVRDAVTILERHPHVGRPFGGSAGLRELIVSHGATGYVVLYEHSAAENLIRIVAVRHQREAGYRG